MEVATERLQRDDEAQAAREQLEERRRRADRDEHPAVDEEQIGREKRDRASEAGLLGERVEDEVAPDDGDALGHSIPEARSEEAAVPERIEPLHELI